MPSDRCIPAGGQRQFYQKSCRKCKNNHILDIFFINCIKNRIFHLLNAQFSAHASCVHFGSLPGRPCQDGLVRQIHPHGFLSIPNLLKYCLAAIGNRNFCLFMLDFLCNYIKIPAKGPNMPQAHLSPAGRQSG